MKKYITLGMFTALLLGVGFFVHVVQAAKSSEHQKKDLSEVLKTRSNLFTSAHDKQLSAKTDRDTQHATFQLNHEKTLELNRITHALAIKHSKNLDTVTLSSELSDLKAKIEADTTSTDLETDSDALTDLIAPAKK